MHLELRTEAWDIDLDVISLGVDDIDSCGNGWYVCVCSNRWSWPHTLLLKAFHISSQTPQACKVLHGFILAYLSRLLIDFFLRTLFYFYRSPKCPVLCIFSEPFLAIFPLHKTIFIPLCIIAWLCILWVSMQIMLSGKSSIIPWDSVKYSLFVLPEQAIKPLSVVLRALYCLYFLPCFLLAYWRQRWVSLTTVPPVPSTVLGTQKMLNEHFLNKWGVNVNIFLSWLKFIYLQVSENSIQKGINA